LPTKALKPCSTPGCCNLTKDARCSICTRNREQLRGNSSQRGYGAQHRKRRTLVLQRDPLCVACDAQGKVEASTVYDHIIAIEAGGDETDMDNAQGMCQHCHSVKRAAERCGRQLQVVSGRGLVDIGALGTKAVRVETLEAA
jgi:5-methylcytosine-specific restriction protein A